MCDSLITPFLVFRSSHIPVFNTELDHINIFEIPSIMHLSKGFDIQGNETVPLGDLSFNFFFSLTCHACGTR